MKRKNLQEEKNSLWGDDMYEFMRWRLYLTATSLESHHHLLLLSYCPLLS